MSVSIKIQISDAPTQAVVHRFRNFGEDIYRELRGSCELDLGEIDRATESFYVHGVKKSDLGRVNKIIKQQLEHHNFAASATITQSNRAQQNDI